jgi:hypothetical protein
MSRAVVVALFGALVLGGCGGSGAPEEIILDLVEQNASGQTGTVTLTSQGDRTQIVVESISPFGRDPQPTHVHKGTCAHLNPQPAYALPSLVDGIGGDTIDIPLSDLLDGEYAVNIHRSESQLDEYTACADITE